MPVIMPVAISTEVVRMPKGSNHHFLNCPPICPPPGRVALALLSLCKTVHVAQAAGRCSRSASRVALHFLVTGGYSELKAESPSFRASGQSSSTSIGRVCGSVLTGCAGRLGRPQSKLLNYFLLLPDPTCDARPRTLGRPRQSARRQQARPTMQGLRHHS